MAIGWPGAWAAPVQADYGNFDIVVPYPAGGSLDGLARIASPAIGREAGGVAMIVNIGGASGAIAVHRFLQRPADGKTLLLGSVAQMMMPTPSGQSLSAETVSLGKVSSADYVIVSGRGFRADSLDEWVAAAARAPNSVSLAHPGQSSIQCLTARIVERTAGIELLFVPYSGSAPLLSDLVSGQVDVALIAVTAAIPLVEAGRLKPLGLLRKHRHPYLPTWPYSGQSASLSQVEASGWVGLFSAAATPEARVQRMRTAVADSLRDTKLRSAIARLGQVAADPDHPDDGARFPAFVQTEIERYQAVSRSLSMPLSRN